MEYSQLYLSDGGFSQEDFMASTKSWLDDLKLRVGYGVVGNDRMNNYNSYAQYAVAFNTAMYPINGFKHYNWNNRICPDKIREP